MSFLSLFSDDRGFLATDQRVFTTSDLPLLTSLIEQSRVLSGRLAQQSEAVENARSAARVEGYAAGIAQARSDATDELAVKLVEVQRQQSLLIERHRYECAELAVDIVRKIAGQIEASDWLLAQALQASEELVDKPGLSLRVHADLQESISMRCKAQSVERFVSVIGDPDMPRHTCILETASGSVEVDLETQLSRVLDMLVGESS